MLLAEAFAESGEAYALIGGVALQAHLQEPRTTLAIDLAVPARDAIPRQGLQARGFVCTGSFPHSENWSGADGTPVQFTDVPILRPAIARCDEIEVEGRRLRLLRRVDLLHEKLRAGADPARRQTKRMQDLVDAQALLEACPALASELTAEERLLLDRLP